MNLELLTPAQRIVMIMERIYADGMTTTSGGNLSILEENGDIWITPRAVDKGTLRPKDVVQVKPDGNAIGTAGLLEQAAEHHDVTAGGRQRVDLGLVHDEQVERVG